MVVFKRQKNFKAEETERIISIKGLLKGVCSFIVEAN